MKIELHIDIFLAPCKITTYFCVRENAYFEFVNFLPCKHNMQDPSGHTEEDNIDGIKSGSLNGDKLLIRVEKVSLKTHPMKSSLHYLASFIYSYFWETSFSHSIMQK